MAGLWHKETGLERDGPPGSRSCWAVLGRREPWREGRGAALSSVGVRGLMGQGQEGQCWYDTGG